MGIWDLHYTVTIIVPVLFLFLPSSSFLFYLSSLLRRLIRRRGEKKKKNKKKKPRECVDALHAKDERYRSEAFGYREFLFRIRVAAIELFGFIGLELAGSVFTPSEYPRHDPTHKESDSTDSNRTGQQSYPSYPISFSLFFFFFSLYSILHHTVVFLVWSTPPIRNPPYLGQGRDACNDFVELVQRGHPLISIDSLHQNRHPSVSIITRVQYIACLSLLEFIYIFLY